MCDLTQNQLKRLARYIADDYGPDLTCENLADCILLNLENIAGFDMANDRLLQFTIDQIGRYYYVHNS